MKWNDDYWGVSEMTIQEKIDHLNELKKRHPQKVKLINSIIKRYEDGTLGNK